MIIKLWPQYQTIYDRYHSYAVNNNVSHFHSLIIFSITVLDTDCVTLKQNVFELLSALCLLSDKGYNLTLDALESHKV